MYFCSYTKCACFSCLPFHLPYFCLSPLRQEQLLILLLLSLLNVKMRKMKTLMMIFFHLIIVNDDYDVQLKSLSVADVCVWKFSNCMIRTIWDFFSLSLSSLCRASCARLVWKWIAYLYIDIRWVIFNIKLLMC